MNLSWIPNLLYDAIRLHLLGNKTTKILEMGLRGTYLHLNTFPTKPTKVIKENK